MSWPQVADATLEIRNFFTDAGRVRSLLKAKSVPQLAVDIPYVTALPTRAEDRMEVYLVTGNVVAHYLYRAAVPGWVATANLPVETVTTLPADPYEGQQVDYIADGTGVLWRLKYRAAGGTYPWEAAGATPLTARVDTDQATASGAFAALATAGPSITVPLAGDYIVEGRSNGYASAIATILHSYDLGGVAAVAANAGQAAIAAANYSAMLPFSNRHNGLAAATQIVSKYATTAGTANFRYRWLSVQPVRVAA